jgi:hypothetical protein
VIRREEIASRMARKRRDGPPEQKWRGKNGFEANSIDGEVGNSDSFEQSCREKKFFKEQRKEH